MCSNDWVRRGRVLALDYGTKNVGLACCDELGIVVRPLRSLRNLSRRKLVNHLRSVIQGNRIDTVVVGIPRNMNGTIGPAMRRAQRFVQYLRSELALPVATVDERLSTVEASEVWSGMSARQQRKYGTVDSLAAAFILERFLRNE